MGVFVALWYEIFWVSFLFSFFFLLGCCFVVVVFLRQFISPVACFCNLRKYSCLRMKAMLVVTNLFHPITQQQGET